MTTEVIADGRHLSADLLRFALAMKGADRLALVTDCSRALDQPPGEYVFGPAEGGEMLYSDGEVGLTADRAGLASSVRGMDFMVRHMVQAAGVDCRRPCGWRRRRRRPSWGWKEKSGAWKPGKRADVVLLDADLKVRAVFVDGV